MEVRDITSDVELKGDKWSKILEVASPKLFRTQYQIFVVCTAIGIMKDKRKEIQLTPDQKDVIKYIPRTVLLRNLFDLELLFNTAIISTTTENLTVDERLRIAFSEEQTSFKKMKMLEEFANYGAEVFYDALSYNDLEYMENLKDAFDNLIHSDLLEDIEIDCNLIM